MTHAESGQSHPPLHIAYVGPVDFPSSSANAQRMAGIAQALEAAGDYVTIGSAGRNGTLAAQDRNSGRVVAKLSELPDPEWPEVRRIWRVLNMGAATRTWIREMDPAPDLILLYGCSLGYLIRLIPVARRLSIPLVIDAVEWYESSHLAWGRFGPFALANAVSMRFAAAFADGVIAISRVLALHFEAQGLPVLRIPPLFAISGGSPRPVVHDRPLVLCYVGAPGKKDARTLRNLILLPSELGLNSTQLRIQIVGVDKDAAVASLGNGISAAINHESLQFHGRLPSNKARRIVSKSHFSVLQRGGERYAQAGFPSKVPESLLLGTPVMANFTSDLGEFLEDGTNARVLADPTLTTLTNAVSRALREPYEFDRDSIAVEAQNSFSPEKHATSIHKFLLQRLMKVHV